MILLSFCESSCQLYQRCKNRLQILIYKSLSLWVFLIRFVEHRKLYCWIDFFLTNTMICMFSLFISPEESNDSIEHYILGLLQFSNAVIWYPFFWTFKNVLSIINLFDISFSQRICQTRGKFFPLGMDDGLLVSRL